MAYIGKQPVVGNFQVCDAISVVNGQAAYTMQVGSANVEPENANHMLVSLNGVLQKPGSSFTISGATITFASNLATNDVIDFIILLGDTLNIGTPSDDSVGAAQIKNDLISGTTALTSSPDGTDELLISDAGTLKRIDVSLVGGKNTPAFFAHSASAQTGLSDNTYTKVTLGTEVFDVGTCFGSSRFTVPSGEAGKYFLYGSIRCECDANSELNNSYSAFYLNGSIYIENRMSFQSNPVRFATNLNHVVLDLSVGDYVELYGSIDTSSAARQFGSSSKGTSFGGYKIIE